MAQTTINNGDSGATVRSALNTMFGELYAGGAKKNNFGASTNPATTDDTGSGYAAGSLWFNTTTGQLWVCRSASSSAAVWLLIDYADHTGYISGNWYQPIAGQVVAGAALSNGTAKFLPFFFESRVTISTLGCRITTLAAGGNVQLAIYASNPSTGRPTGSELAVTASITTASGGNVNADITGADVTFDPGMYWMGVNADNGTVVLQTIAVAQVYTSWLVGASTQNNISSNSANGALAVSTPLSFGTWGDLTGATWTEFVTAAHGIVQFKVA